MYDDITSSDPWILKINYIKSNYNMLILRDANFEPRKIVKPLNNI